MKNSANDDGERLQLNKSKLRFVHKQLCCNGNKVTYNDACRATDTLPTHVKHLTSPNHKFQNSKKEFISIRKENVSFDNKSYQVAMLL